MKRKNWLRMWRLCTDGISRPKVILTDFGTYLWYRASSYGVTLHFYEVRDSSGKVISSFGRKP